jgi:hypothetical protein
MIEKQGQRKRKWFGIGKEKEKPVQTMNCRQSEHQEIYQIKERGRGQSKGRIVVFERSYKQNLFLSCFLRRFLLGSTLVVDTSFYSLLGKYSV